MQQNLNPKGKKKAKQDNARNQRNGLAPAASGRRRLSSLLLACRGLRTLAHCTSPVKKNVHDRPWTDITVLESPEMAFTNFLEKTTKALDRKLPDGRELLELLPFIVLFVMHQLRRVY